MSWYPRHKVLVPIDFSEASLAVVDVGISLVDAPSNLYVLHVAPAVVKRISGSRGIRWRKRLSGNASRRPWSSAWLERFRSVSRWWWP